MTPQSDDGKQIEAPSGDAAAPSAGRRRMVLRGATAALPAILTLHSGAALARTSNLISLADGAPVDSLGRNLCLNESSVTPLGGNLYDLGEPASAQVTAIPTDRTYYTQSNSGQNSQKVTGLQMCQTGGDFYYQSSGWKKVSVPRGGLVSATALASFAGRVTVREI